MFKIVRKERLNDMVSLIEVHAPYIAKKSEPGQFIILRIDEQGERVPFTIADFDREKGTVTIIFQIVGKTTEKLNTLCEGDTILDFVGPLGVASHFENVKSVAVIGGGLGTAIAYPQAKKLHSMGVSVDMINGFRNKDIIIIEEECQKVCTDLYTMTDDGSNGNKGFVTTKLEELIENGKKYDMVIAIGQTPNPLIRNTTPDIETDSRGCIIVKEKTGETCKEGVFAGGDAVTGAATVILAMGAGKSAAAAIDEYIREKN